MLLWNSLKAGVLASECCAICGGLYLSATHGWGICDSCRDEVAHAPGPFEGATRRSALPWIALFAYSGIIVELVAAIKRRGDRRPLGALVHAAHSRLEPEHIRAATLIPVPCSRQGRIARGFDQTRLFCDSLHAAQWHPLVRRRGVQQKKLAREARYEQAQRQLEVGRRAARPTLPNHITSLIIVDDVLTTGASIERSHELIGTLIDTLPVDASRNASEDARPPISALTWCVDR